MSRTTAPQHEDPPPGGAKTPTTGLSETSDTDVDRRSPYRPKYVPLWNNLITMLGFFLAAMAVVLLMTFGLFSVVTPNANPYVDIVGFLVLPSILVVGVALVPVGIFFKSWRLHRKDPEQRLAFRFPRVDLNDPKQRSVAKVAVLGGFVLLPVVGLSSYHGYHYTDSSAFCSKACHAVMHPQATTYEHSAHARVACAECHIGSGASWFVKSKLSGTRQVLAMWEKSYPRPIPPAITELRPARETCEHCHWPKKFFGAQLREIVHFATDEQNTRHEIDMLLNTGGGDESTGRAEGLHMHLALANAIEYIATDDLLQDIPWVKWTDTAGRELIYRSDGKPSSDPKPEGKVRRVDCMDCHNRPAHKFRSPGEALDIYLDVGKIDTTLPYIKRQAVLALIKPYTDTETAESQIGVELTEYYRENHPEVWATRKASVNHAIDGIRTIYRSNFFPEMKVDWQTYPDNVGHMLTPGCFRCHEGQHVNQHGEAISHECHVCHTFLNPVGLNGDTPVIRKGEFIHPMLLEGRHAEIRCDQCHGGRVPPVPECAGCHATQADFRTGALADFAAFDIPPSPMAEAVDCEGCHDLSEPTDIETIDAMCMDCHDDEERFEGMLASWQEEADRLIEFAETRVDGANERIIQLLREAGPYHNMEATRKIVHALSPESMEPSEP